MLCFRPGLREVFDSAHKLDVSQLQEPPHQHPSKAASSAQTSSGRVPLLTRILLHCDVPSPPACREKPTLDSDQKQCLRPVQEAESSPILEQELRTLLMDLKSLSPEEGGTPLPGWPSTHSQPLMSSDGCREPPAVRDQELWGPLPRSETQWMFLGSARKLEVP